MGASSSPPFNGITGQEPPDPVAGKPGHFAWSRWIKAFVKRLDTETVKRSGDSLSGKLTMPSTAPGDSPTTAATKDYVETRVGSALSKTGGSLTGKVSAPLTIPTDPSDTLVTKSYVDSNIGNARRTWQDFN
jgi:hypothetical protein